MSGLFTSGGQSFGASASASTLWGKKVTKTRGGKRKKALHWLYPPTHDVAHPRVKHKAHGQPGGSNLTEASPLQGEPSPGLLSHPSLSQQQNTCICFLLHPLPKYTEQTEAAGPLAREWVLPGLVPSRTAPFLRSPGEGRHLYLHFNFFFWPHCVARRILVPQPGIKPLPPAVEGQSLNHWTIREVLYIPIL